MAPVLTIPTVSLNFEEQGRFIIKLPDTDQHEQIEEVIALTLQLIRQCWQLYAHVARPVRAWEGDVLKAEIKQTVERLDALGAVQK